MNIVFGEYINKKSILHHLDPRIKLIGSFSFIFSFLFVDSFLGYFIAGLLVMLLTLLSKIPLYQFLKSLKYLLYILIFSAIFHIISQQNGKIIFQFGKYAIYESGLISAYKMLFKIVFLLIFSSLLTLTTKPFDIALALETLLKPLKKLGLPIQDFSIMLSITLRFIPTVLQEVNTIKMAQQARGENFDTKNPFKKLYQYSMILFPLLVSVIQKVEHLTLAMEARAYSSGMERNNFYKLKLKKIDYIAGVIIFLISLILIIF